MIAIRHLLTVVAGFVAIAAIVFATIAAFAGEPGLLVLLLISGLTGAAGTSFDRCNPHATHTPPPPTSPHE